MKTTIALFLSVVTACPFPNVTKGASGVKANDQNVTIPNIKPECPQFSSKDVLIPQVMVPISASEPDKMFGYVREPVVTPNDIWCAATSL